MDIEILRSEIERLFSLDELTTLSRELLGLDPDKIGGTTAKASFARALTDHCSEIDALEALAEAVLGSRSNADPRLRELNQIETASEGALKPGSVVGEFTLTRKIGDGSASAVYAAESGGRGVVLKVLKHHATTSRAAVQRYLTVSRMVGRIEHAGLPQAVEAGQLPDGGSWYVAYAAPEGETLTQRVRRNGPMQFQEARPLLTGLLEALGELHSRGLAHGNVKLNNILVCGTGRDAQQVVLIDAGVDRLGLGARAAGGPASSVLGSTTLSPEQVRGKMAGPASDVYAVGAVMYEMLTGKPLYQGATPFDACVANLLSEPQAPSQAGPPGWISREVDQLVLAMLNKDPKRRPRDAQAALEDLERIGRTDDAFAQGLISDDELDGRISDLMRDPSDENAALQLESAVQEGADPARVAQVFLMAAEQANGDGLDVFDPDLKKNLLYRAARVHEGAGQKEQAEKVYTQILSLDAGDDIAAAALQRIRMALGKYDEVVELLLERADAAGSGPNKARKMAEIGRIYAKELDDRSQALVAYVQAFCDDPQNGAYADEVERLAGSDAASWNEATSACAQASTEDRPSDVKVPLFLRLGRWYTDKLSRPDLAVACFQAILAVDPSHDSALAALCSVYRKAQQWSELAQVLERRASAAPSPNAARNLSAEAAEILETKLNDDARARELYQKIVDDDPTHKAACEGMERLLEKAGDFPALVRVLEARAQALRGEQRDAVLARVAEVYEDNLNDLPEATRRYEAILFDSPTSALALKGLDRIYNRSGRYKDLVGILNREIEVAVTPRQRITLQERLAALYEEEFLDHAAAAEACEAVLDLDPTHDGALTSLVRHYRALDRWEDAAKTYERHIHVAPTDARKVELGLALGRVLSEQIGSPTRAATAYEEVLAIEPANGPALDAIARLRTGTGDSNLALQAIETLAHQASTPEAKAEQWIRAARLLENAGDLDGAIERYKAALDAQPRHPVASDALRAAHIARGDAGAAIELIERQIELAEGGLQKAKLFGEMARVCKYKLNDGERAVLAATQAHRLDPSNVDALVVLGETAFEEGHFLEAASHLELPANRSDRLAPEDATRVLVRYVDSLYKTGESEKALAAMETLLRVAPDNADALTRAARVMFDHATPKRAYDLYHDILTRFRERMTLAEEADALYRFGEAARRAGLVEEAFAPLFEAADLDPTAAEPLASLAKLYEARADWENVVQTKQRRLDVAQGEERYELLLEVAEILASKVQDRTRAAKAYVAALEERSDDRNVLTKLMQLYSEEKDWSKLVEVVDKLSNFVDEKKQKAKYLQTAAMVSARHLGDLDAALGYYEHALDLDPTNTKCLEEAVVIRKQKGDYAGVETLLKVKLEHANEEGDQVQMLEAFQELADLYHKNLGWIGAAIDAYEAAQTLDPENKEREELLAGLYASDPAQYLEKAVLAQRNILRRNPDHAESYKLLRKLYTEVKRADPAWCMCQALHVLNLCEPDEERFFRRMRATAPAAARTQLNADEFQQLLVAAEVDPNVSGIFALIEPALLAARAAPFQTLGYDPSYAIDLASHASQLARMVYYAASVLGIGLPPAFENPNDPGALSFLHAQTPSIVVGQYGLTAEIPPQTAAFIAARHVVYYRPGLYVRHLVPTGTGLRAWLFAAIKLISPQFPILPELEGPVNESHAALEKAIVGPTRERLASHVSKILASGAPLDLKRWVAGIDLTADRAGFLLTHDLQTACEIVKALGEEASAVPVKDRLKDLVLFATSEEYFALRSKLGLAIDS